MQKPQFTIGIDVSKNTLDVYCSEIKQHRRITNDTAGFKAFLSFCRSEGIHLQQAFIVLEYTGGYEYKLLQFCESKNIALPAYTRPCYKKITRHRKRQKRQG